MFTVIFGDSYTGSFKYSINSVQYPVLSPTGNTNYVGDNDYEVIAFVDEAFDHTASTLIIEFICDDSGSGFCAISDYFLLRYLEKS
jgi:hypothetical protein